MTHAVTVSSAIAQGSTPHGARTRPAVITTTRSAREPMPTSPRRPERLGAGAGVRDEKRAGDRGHRDRDEDVPAVAREDVGDRGEHEALADAVGRRVEEGAERRRLAAGAGECAVEDVEDRADDEDEGREPVERRGRCGPRRARGSTRPRTAATPVAVSAFGVTRVRARPEIERVASVARDRSCSPA